MSDISLPKPLRLLLPNPKRALIAGALLLLAIAPGSLGELTRSLMTDAFFQVSAFVAATLMLFYGAERLFNFNIGSALMRAKGWQIPIASLLGAMPGCGGAVVVVAAYSSGHVTFGAVVATLTATMGDAAFLLIATRPDVAAVVLPLSFSVGIVTGFIVDRFHKKELRDLSGAAVCEAVMIGKIQARHWAYLAAIIPSLVFGIAQLAQIEMTSLAGINAQVFALSGTAVGVLIWALSPVQAMTNVNDAPVTRMAEETAFISIWVIGAYLAYDYAASYLGLDLEAMFTAIAPALPLIAILIGFIPGCGPQVLVTTLYINGLVPFAALLGNAISNDGDALFPAIALNPRAAVLATAYSAIPALIIAYVIYFAAPNAFM